MLTGKGMEILKKSAGALTLLVMLLTTTTVAADELVVKTFSQSTVTVLTGSRLRKDLNDEYCALVRVALPEDKASFEGDVVGGTTYEAGEYSVYLVRGTKMFRVKYAGCEPIIVRFADYGIESLQGRAVYDLVFDPDLLINTTQALPSRNFTLTIAVAGHGYVDLGLSVLWATVNMGADIPSDYGDYYQWGATTSPPDNNYTASNCETYGKTIGDIKGDSLYDVASAEWGAGWRLPTKAEMEELGNKCIWTWTTQGGHKGYKVTGANGNSIFLPAAGYRDGTSLCDAGSYGYYWSSSPYESDSQCAEYMFLNSSSSGTGWGDRFFGHTIRPVVE